MHTLRQPDDRHAYTLSAAHPPIAAVPCGESIGVETVDAFGGALRSEADLFSERCPGPPRSNPLTGPIYVEGAEPGDTLLVTIERIEPRGDQAVTALIPEFGALTGSAQTATLDEPLPERTRVLPIEGGDLVWRDRLRLPLAPFLGTIGTAPDLEAISSLTCGYWGGNLDCAETGPGATVWLPVKNEGALFFCGDAHALQGDGELTGVAAEMAARVVLRFGLLKAAPIAAPRITTDTHLMALGCARPLEDAARMAARELVRWLADEADLDPLDAYELVGLVGELRVGALVNPNYSVAAKIARRWVDQLSPRAG
ncbi:acetamidase/formamidase family protein [Botrimarina sp.]|uniref:acetamidase/formamidase family protein n=1 Tax=Botrimarina sp. TaxID=2795802 RepID=UPI0032EE34A1